MRLASFLGCMCCWLSIALISSSAGAQGFPQPEPGAEIDSNDLSGILSRRLYDHPSDSKYSALIDMRGLALTPTGPWTTTRYGLYRSYESTDPVVSMSDLREKLPESFRNASFGELDWSPGPVTQLQSLYGGFLFVPLQTVGDDAEREIGVALFSSRDGAYLTLLPFPDDGRACQRRGSGAISAGWVAVGSMRVLLSSADTPNRICRYIIDWPRLKEALHDGSSIGPPLQYVGELPLLDAAGRVMSLRFVKGGELTPNRKVLYLVSGSVTPRCNDAPDDVSGDWMRANGGLYAFEMASGRLLAKSNNTGGEASLFYDPDGDFEFPFDPTRPGCHAPGGIAYWDYDFDQGCMIDGKTGAQGQLHVSLTSHQMGGLARDSVAWIRHYSNRVYVHPEPPHDHYYTEGDEVGRNLGHCYAPARSLAKAIALAQPGHTIVLAAGRYQERIRITLPVRIVSYGGAARVE